MCHHRQRLHRQLQGPSLSVQDLKTPEQLYRKLGCKLAVGMPFKDIATSDTLYLPRLPPADDKEARRALIRLQVGRQHNPSACEGPANVLCAVWLTSGLTGVPARGTYLCCTTAAPPQVGMSFLPAGALTHVTASAWVGLHNNFLAAIQHGRQPAGLATCFCGLQVLLGTWRAC